MPSMTRSASVDRVVQLVESLLSGEPGRERLKRFNQLVNDVGRSRPTLRDLRARLRQRAAMQLYVNVSNVKQAASRGAILLSVRVHGIECGLVTVGTTGARVFEPRNRKLFGPCGADDADGREWGDAAVARYVKAGAARPVTGRPEAGIESALILKMRRPYGEWRGE